MRFDRDGDWRKHLDERRKMDVQRRTNELGATQRSALAAKRVTGDEDWDHYLSIVQERIDALTRTRDQGLQRLVESDEFSTDALINLKLAIRLHGAQIDALEWVIGLPKELKEKGDRAEQLLRIAGESAS